MLILIFFTFLVTNISVINCIGTFEEINVETDYNNMNCKVNKEYKLPAGTAVVVTVKNKSIQNIKRATVKKYAKDQINPENFSFQIDNSKVLPLYIPNNNFNKTYNLFFTFMYDDQGQNPFTQSSNHPMCNSSILYESIPNEAAVSKDKESPDDAAVSKNKEWWQTYVAIAGVVAGIVIIALLATTIYYKRQANMLSKPVSLVRRVERADETDRDRYCSNPRKGKKVSPILNNSRDSDIYEDPGIILSKGVNSTPPAIPTTPRPNQNYLSTLKKPASPSMTLKSNSPHQSLTRPRAPDKETPIKVPIAQRPRLSLPKDEFYPAVQEDDTYEEPPVPERPSPTTLTRKPEQQERIGTIPKKIAKPEVLVRPRTEKVAKAFEQKLGKTLPNIPMDGLKPPGVKQIHKPAVSNNKPTPPRNNVVQVPIRKIPDPSSLKKAPQVKTKPIVRPKTPPSPTSEQVQFFNDDRRDSTDDEYWTYEPLPQYNIYNN